MSMEQAMDRMENITEKMKKADEQLDDLAEQVGSIEHEISSENLPQLEVNDLLKSVNEVKSNYQNLRKQIGEVQDLQRELSTTLQLQLRMMQAKFNTLKGKIEAAHQPKIENSTQN